MAVWNEVIEDFHALVNKPGVTPDEIKGFMHMHQIGASYPSRLLSKQLLDLVEKASLSAEKKIAFNAAILEGINEEYGKTHFASEDDMIDSLSQLFNTRDFDEVKGEGLCAEAVISFYVLAWYGFNESQILEIKKCDLDCLENTIHFNGHEIPVSPRAMEILQAYACSEGYFRASAGGKGFFRYVDSPFLFRSYRSPRITSAAARSFRRRLGELVESRNHPHLFLYDQILLNGALCIMYQWEKNIDSVAITPHRMADKAFAEDLFEELIYVISDPYTLAAKHYPMFYSWMENYKSLEEAKKARAKMQKK